MLELHKAERTRLGLRSAAAVGEEGEAQLLDVAKEKAVVELKGVRAVHVEDLGQNPGASLAVLAPRRVGRLIASSCGPFRPAPRHVHH